MPTIPHPSPTTDPPADPPAERFTFGLISDVFDVLERHGYRRPDGQQADRATGAAVGALLGLVRAFEDGDPASRSV